jgi:CBS domain-containing protein
LSDGDLRRAIRSSNDLKAELVKNHMSKQFMTVKTNSLAIDALRIMEDKKNLICGCERSQREKLCWIINYAFFA